MMIKKNDTVIVLSGKDKGKKGKVLVAMPKDNKVVVEGVNVATCHTKPRKQGETGGIVKKETPIRTCKVALVCNNKNCKNNGKNTRAGFKLVDGKKIRVCVACGAEL
ncbi:MAG TPA: 50S ribosomal protein L24 [Candidatus Faecousia faecigallinarum]|nr:50S ribosomal protein L24 [Candidatus Faecousia faecigallinarum]